MCKKPCPSLPAGSLCSLDGQAGKAFKERLWLTRAVGNTQAHDGSNQDSETLVKKGEKRAVMGTGSEDKGMELA